MQWECQLFQSNCCPPFRVKGACIITNHECWCVGDKPPSAFDENPPALDEGMASHAEVLELQMKLQKTFKNHRGSN